MRFIELFIILTFSCLKKKLQKEAKSLMCEQFYTLL